MPRKDTLSFREHKADQLAVRRRDEILAGKDAVSHIYRALLILRLLCALSPSYLHLDENFQSLEPMAGSVVGRHTDLPWEFDGSAPPIRAVGPILLFQGFPLFLCKLAWSGFSSRSAPPRLLFYASRMTMWAASVWLGDSAFLELAKKATARADILLLLYASSWTTLVIQTHTFSNSIESIVVLWCIVLAERSMANSRGAARTGFLLGVLTVFGIFNRITAPAFLLLHGGLLLRWAIASRRYSTLCSIAVGGAIALLVLIGLDTSYHRQVVITPLNFLRYNSDSSNLAKHGLHPRWQHALVNLPVLLGPALFWAAKNRFSVAGLLGVLCLSVFPHQEARFLLPAVSLLLLAVRPAGPVAVAPQTSRISRRFVIAWIAFNAITTIVYGALHQAGVFPAQWFLQAAHTYADSPSAASSSSMPYVDWWQVYDPPLWLGPTDEPHTGIRRDDSAASVNEVMRRHITAACAGDEEAATAHYLVTPSSNLAVKDFNLKAVISGEDLDAGPSPAGDGQLRLVWRTLWHLSLDDIGSGVETHLESIWRIATHPGLDIWRLDVGC